MNLETLLSRFASWYYSCNAEYVLAEVMHWGCVIGGDASPGYTVSKGALSFHFERGRVRGIYGMYL